MPRKGQVLVSLPTAEVVRLYTEERLSLHSIGKRFGCSYHPVRECLQAAGVGLRHKGNSKGAALPDRISLDEAELRRLYVDEKWPSDRLGERYGTSGHTILRRLRRMGVQVRHHNDTKRGRPSNRRVKIDERRMATMYEVDGLTIEQVAEQIGVSPAAVQRRLVELGVERRPISEYAAKRVGPANGRWRADLTQEERERRRPTSKSSEWRNAVYERDGFTCQCCGDARGGNLNAHHLNSHNRFRSQRWDVDNGVTLCRVCHRGFHKRFGYGDNTAEQFAEFLNQQRRAAA